MLFVLHAVGEVFEKNVMNPPTEVGQKWKDCIRRNVFTCCYSVSLIKMWWRTL
jgi:hypothetical protein